MPRSLGQPRPRDSAFCKIIEERKGSWVGIMVFRSAGLITSDFQFGPQDALRPGTKGGPA